MRGSRRTTGAVPRPRLLSPKTVVNLLDSKPSIANKRTGLGQVAKPRADSCSVSIGVVDIDRTA